ncbi:hypothetical protein HYH03_008945 [Edaphochlamys debaryana]|uniref:Uncharacterized protein n=1 Tax=Edaphochlamys debaryana TaxID=47281 RepID=A0A835Y863_9CHLO|nr:hypothetical protein HYH03_008945 [Edaphochlamys debaryana]|eukprot:KAG2492784.1 hypothetical protein HYH03_008945 [Edaphochlamys debaryana]
MSAKVAPEEPAPGGGGANGPAAGAPPGLEIRHLGLAGFVKRYARLANEWTVLSSLVPPKDLRVRLQTEWSTMGIVCSLLVTLAYSIFTAPPAVMIQGGGSQTVFVLICGGSVAFNLCCVALSTFLLVQLNLMTDDEVLWFTRSYSWVNGVNFVVFLFATLLLVATLMSIAIKLYDSSGIIVSGLIGGTIFVVASIIFMIDSGRKMARIRAGVGESFRLGGPPPPSVGAAPAGGPRHVRAAGSLKDDEDDD